MFSSKGSSPFAEKLHESGVGTNDGSFSLRQDQGVVAGPAVAPHEIGDNYRGTPVYASVAMNEYRRTGAMMLVDESHLSMNPTNCGERT